MKRFVRRLRPNIKRKLILFQLQIYVQAMEKVLEVERDMLKDQKVQNKELLPPKCPRYQEIPSSKMSKFKFNRNMGSSVVPDSRYNSSVWHR